MGCSSSRNATHPQRPLAGSGRAAVGLPPRHLGPDGARETVPAEPPRCRNGCTMVHVGQTPSSEKHYVCNACGGKSRRGHLGGDKCKRWRCHKCDYEVCFQCHPDRHLAKKEPDEQPDRLARCTTVEVKRILQGQLCGLEGIPVLNNQAQPADNSEDDFYRRCRAALEPGASGAALEAAAPTRLMPPPSTPASPMLLARCSPVPAGKRAAPGGATPYDVLAPDEEFKRVQDELKRRPTLEVKRILQQQLQGFEGDPHLKPGQAESSPLPDEDIRETFVPELQHMPRDDRGVRCTCMA